MSLKMYVLVREDLTAAQQAVQAGHALAKFGLDHPKEFKAWQEDSNILVYLSVDSIDKWATVLSDGEFLHSVFFEPDLSRKFLGPSDKSTGWIWGGGNTAVAVAPNWTCQYVLFKDLPLALQPEVEDSRKKWSWR